MSTENKPKRVIVHVKQANGITGFVSKKGKSTSDCFAMVTLLGSSPLQKFTTKTIKKTTVKPLSLIITHVTYYFFLIGTNLESMVLLVKYNTHYIRYYLLLLF